MTHSRPFNTLPKASTSIGLYQYIQHKIPQIDATIRENLTNSSASPTFTLVYTCGFLYYHKAPPKAPPFVGDVHFRLASDLDSFHHDDDLLSPDKTVPWTISPHSPANRAKLAEQLLLDGLASQMTLDDWAKIKPMQRLLYYRRQPFPLRFGTSCFAFYTATGERISRCVLASPIADRRDANHHVLPYGGELSLQPEVYP